MLAIRVRYLTGRAVAASPSSREQPEWPPHPGRLFMALVAAWGGGERDPQEQKALEWLEGEPPPALAVSGAAETDVPGHFVPANDKLFKSEDLKRHAKMAGLPASRLLTERHFPSVVPDRPDVWFIWSQSEPGVHRDALAALAARTTHVGHSRSLVAASLDDAPPEATLVPSENGANLHLRVPSAGWLAELEAEHARLLAGGQRAPGTLVGAWQGYREAAPASRAAAPDFVAGTMGADLLILVRKRGPRLFLRSTLLLTEALRGAVLGAADQPAPEVLTGHAADGRPTTRPHAAFVPLADVGHPHAEGAIVGLAMALPRDLAPTERGVCERALANVQRLTMGDAGAWDVDVPEPGDARVSVDPSRWVAPSRRWASVTPVVLDRYPKGDVSVEDVLALACERAGFPRPVDILAHDVSLHRGAPAACEFPAMPARPGRPQRWHTHVLVTFDQPVAGPILLGAGRFRGYGLLRPLRGYGRDT